MLIILGVVWWVNQNFTYSITDYTPVDQANKQTNRQLTWEFLHIQSIFIQI